MKSESYGINPSVKPSGTGCGVAGGSIFADAPDVVISAAVIVRQVSMHQSTTQQRVIRLLRVSSRGSGGFTIITPENSSRVPSYPLRSGIH